MAGQVISRLTSSGGDDAGVHVISSSFYGTCSSAANAENKEVIIQNRNVGQVNLTKGILLTVKFTNKNDYPEDGKSLPTLQLFKNEATPDSIPIKGSGLTNPMTIFAQQNNNIKPNGSAGSVVTFIYDTYIKQNNDGTTSTLGCGIKTAGLSEEIFDNLNIRIDGVESASTIAISGVADRVDSIESNIIQAAVVGDIEFIYWPIDSTTTPPVTPAASYDGEETFDVNCEGSTDALPYVFGLDIGQRTKSFTIGNASNPTYSDPIRITGRDGAKGDKGDQGEPGTTGSPAYSYSIISNITSMTRDVNVTPHVNNPSTITFSATKTEGNNNPTSYRGQLQISQYINNQGSSLRSKALMESDSITVTPSNEATLVRGILFTIDGNTQLDSQSVSIIETGENGKNAAIAYLTNESHGFAATSSAAITASVSSQFIVNQDGQELNTTITNITFDPFTQSIVDAQGLATTYSGNTFTVSVNPAFTTSFSHQGTLSVSATASVNGSSQTFTKDFSGNLVPAGIDGENGINTANVKLYKIAMNTPGKPQGDVTYNFNTQTVTANDGILNGWSISVPDMSTATAGVSCYLISANVLASVNQNTDVITENEGYGPIVYTKNGRNGEPGSAGYNQATISLHQRYNPTEQNPTPSKPGDNTYNFTTGEFTSINALGNGSKEVEAASNGEPDGITSVNLISQATSTSVTSAQGSAPVIFTRDGAAGLNAYLYEVQCNPSVIMFDQNVENPAFSPTAITLSATKTEGNNSPESCEGYFKLEYTNDNQTGTSIYTSAQAESTLNCSITSQYIPTPTNVTQLRASLYKTNNMTVTPIDFEDIPVIRSGLNGTNGINGYNQASVFLYQRSANQPTNKPTDNLIYTFADKTLTPANKYTPTGTLNQIPAATDQNNNPAWMISAIASSTATTDTITTNEGSTPIKIEGVDGEDGYNQTIVSLYQRASSAPQTKPTVTAYYTFTDNTITTSPTDGLTGGSLNIPTGPNPCGTISALARSQTNTATIESNTGSDVSKFVEDGKSGYNNATIYIYQRADSSPSVPNTNLTYTFDTCSLNLPQNSSGSQEIPEKTEQNNGILGMTTAVANSTATTDTITSTDGSEVIQLEGVNGIPGQAGYNQATIQLYQRANNSPSVPNSTLTYTFNSNSLTPKDSGSTDTTPTYQGGYRQIPVVNGQPCGVTSGTAISRDSSAIISNGNTPTKILEDSVNVIIDNDNVTFPTTNGAAAKTTVTCSIKAFKGLTQVPCTIGNINGTVTGITTTITTQGTTSTPTAKVTITASNTNSLLLTTEQGTLTIPVTVSGVTNPINKQFTGSLAKNGLNQATLYLYKRATNNPGKPGPAENPQDSEYATYIFSGNNSGLSIPESGSDNNGSITFPTVEQGVTTPVGVSTAIASSNSDTDQIPRSEGSTPTQGISNGANGYNQATISLYKRASNKPTKPSSSLTYNFVNGLSSTLNLNDWRGSVTAATITSGTNQNDYMPCGITSTSPISTETSVTISGDNGSDPTIFIQPGKGIANVVDYYLATTASTGVTTSTQDGDGQTSLANAQISTTTPYLGNYEVTTYTDKTTRTINPHIVATYGKDGTNVTISEIKYGKSNNVSTEPTNGYNETEGASQSIGTGVGIGVKTIYSNNSVSINKSYVGTNGTNGQPGTNSYTHIAGANSSTDGTNDPTNANGKLYLGICINNTQSDASLTYDNYTGSLIQGKSIVSVINKYKTTTTMVRPSIDDTDGIVPNDNTPIPTVSSTNKYLGTYEITTYANPSGTATTQPHLIGAYGDNGVGVTDIIEQAILWDYDDSDLETHSAPTNDRDDGQPRASVVGQSDKYIGVRTKIEGSDGHISYVGPTLAENDNNIGENIDNISNRSVAYSGTCSSSTSAAAKVVTCTNFPTLAAGVTITVRFSNANTVSSALTLNVNSTGAKTIYVNGASTSSSNQLLGAANANISFTYDGTYGRVNSEPRSGYGTCSTGASTAPKTTSINEAVICKGTNVTLNMTNTNTNASATLDVSSTGAKNIYYGTTTTRPTTGDNGNGYGGTAASTVTFVFDGQNGRLGDTSALAGVIKAANDLGTYILSNNIAIQNLQGQIDDQLEIGYGTIDPTISSEPASNGDTNDLKEAHIGDMYYNTTNGKVFQGIKENNTYKGNEIEDEAAANALEAAQNAQSTADGRCKVFIAEEDADSATGGSEPIPPYDVGDIGILGTEIGYAKNKKNENEVFDISDGELSAKDNDSTIEELSKQFIVSTIQLWYACNDDNFSNIPLNFVNIDSDTSDEIYEQGTSKIPLYNKQYPYYYYCYQYQFSDGTYKGSDVVQDISKTEYMNYLQTLENIVENTKTTLNKTNQHFYADDYGAHVIATDGDLNTLGNSTGLLFQDSTIPLLHLGSRNNIGLTIYDGLGDSEKNIISSFIKDKIQLGSMLSNDSLYITITPAQMTFGNKDKQLAYAAGNNFYMPNATINSALNLNNGAGIPRSNGNLSLKGMG